VSKTLADSLLPTDRVALGGDGQLVGDRQAAKGEAMVAPNRPVQ
jgi:hypothetical protein